MKQLLNKEIKISYTTLLLIVILCLATFLLFYRINVLIPFIGDQGWFYLSARDMLLTGQIPLVGITASHPWLHQGALWIYMLSGMLRLFSFDPVSGSYLTAFIGILSVFLIYYVGKLYFSKSVGVIGAILYATSPLVILLARMSYHIAPIPFFTLLFLIAIYKWINGNKYYFPVSIFLLAVLYNFELATATLGLIFILIILYGLIKKTVWFKFLKSTRLLIYACIAYIIPMIPMLMYDVHHGFPQTLKFAAWIGYHLLLLFGFPGIHPNLKPESWSYVLTFSFKYYQSIIFAASSYIAFFIFLVSFGIFYYHFYHMIKSKKNHTGTILIGIITMLLILGFLANRTISDAYLPNIYPFIILVTAVAIDLCKKRFFLPSVLFILIIAILNTYTLIKNNYYFGLSYADRVKAAKEIITEAHGRSYNLVGYGTGSEFESFTMGYQYLTWWLGNGPSKSRQSLQFIIQDMPDKVLVTKQILSAKK